MTITIEMIDELRKRANISFESAKEVLEKYDGNLVEALIHLEKQNKIKFTCIGEKNNLGGKVKELIGKGNNIRFIVSKGGRTTLNLSLTATIVIGVFTFHVSSIALVIALLAGYRFKFEKNGDDMNINAMLKKVHDNVDSFKTELNNDIIKEK